jgi:enediyne biosynthesis protein E4
LGRLDANKVTVLLNDGKGNFTLLNSKNTGIELSGQVRDIILINQNHATGILFLQNNEYPVLYKQRNGNTK